jgi:ketosteroid isomerase-like protein
LRTLVSAWLASDADAAHGVLSPDVRWWTPFGDGSVEGAADAWTALEVVAARTPSPMEVTAMIVNAAGSRGVVELRAGAPARDHRAVLVTFVVTLSDGAVVEGYTYSDVGVAAASAQQ